MNKAMRTWQLQDAKARLSELIKQVIHSGPQGISLRGILEAVIISSKDYEKLTGKKISFVKLMRTSPLKGLNIEIKRDKSGFRDIEL